MDGDIQPVIPYSEVYQAPPPQVLKPAAADIEKGRAPLREPRKPPPTSTAVILFFVVALASAVGFAIALGATSIKWNSPSKPPPESCQVLGVVVKKSAVSLGPNCNSAKTCYNITEALVKAYIGIPELVPTNRAYFSCIDGRSDNEVVATPAGDMGVFLSAAEIYIRNGPSPRDYSQSRLETLLRRFILRFRSPTNKFYMHTDKQSVDNVVKVLNNKNISGFEIQKFYENDFVPPSSAQGALTDALADLATGVGCGHIRLMGQNPASYGIQNAALVTNSLRALWTLKWGDLHDRIFVEALSHDHDEQAMLSIDEIRGCEGVGMLGNQRTDGPFFSQRMFVNHDFNVKAFRDDAAVWFTSLSDSSATLTAASFRQQLDSLADGVQLLASAARLAAGRSIYTVSITGRKFTPPY